MLRDMHQMSSNRGLNHYYLSLDFEKAFDSVNHQWLFQVMTKFGFPAKFIDIVKTLHSIAASEVLINGFRAPPFLIQRGVRQGDPLSLSLLNRDRTFHDRRSQQH